jgi:hypothetical protein
MCLGKLPAFPGQNNLEEKCLSASTALAYSAKASIKLKKVLQNSALIKGIDERSML